MNPKNPLRFESALAKAHKYAKLPEDLSAKLKAIYKENMPHFLNLDGGSTLYTKSGYMICERYDRVVIGDYGAFVEFSVPVPTLIVEPTQKWRMDTERYPNVKYHWLTMPHGNRIKIYLQIKPVTYADYKVDKYYVSVHEVYDWATMMLDTFYTTGIVDQMSNRDQALYAKMTTGSVVAREILDNATEYTSATRILARKFMEICRILEKDLTDKYCNK